jgi:hypothetical protein
MTREYFDEIFCSNENKKTQSHDPEVLEIYSYILKHENRDSDWWNEDHGTNDLIFIIKNCGENVFEKIRQDIPNWSGFQIELFALTMISNHLKDYKINERIKLYLELFDIPKSECDLYNIFYDRLYMNLELADKKLLIKLAEKLNYRSVDHLLAEI